MEGEEEEGGGKGKEGNLSMNCFKGREKNQYLRVIYKGILRFKSKTICGMFAN